MAISTKCC